MNWLYIYFPHLFAETWLADFNGNGAIALIESQHQNQIIVDHNRAAKARGIDVGMNLNTAFCLCPELHVEIPDQHRQQRALEKVATLAARYSAWVGLDAADGLYLEIASMRRLFGEARWQQGRLHNIFQQHGYSTLIATAPNPKAARLLARAGQQGCYDQSLLQKYLYKIPIAALDINPKTEIRLLKLGMRHVHDLAQLPSGDLGYRIDAALAQYLDHISGRATWLPTPFKLPERFYWTLDLEEEFESLEPLRFYLAKGIQAFCQFLQKRSLAARELQLRLFHREKLHGEKFHRQDSRQQQAASIIDIKLASLDNRSESWQYLLNTTIDRQTLSAPVIALQLVAYRFEVLSEQKLTLFKSLSQECGLKKTRLLNRLSTRLGFDCLNFLQLTTDPRPERQTLLAPQAMEELPDINPLPNTPLCLLPYAEAIQQEHYCLKRGPVRLSTGWWDRFAVHRNYYIAEDKNLSAQWLFIDERGQWFRQGWFS